MVCPRSRPRLRLAASLRSTHRGAESSAPNRAGSPSTAALRYRGIKDTPRHPSRSSACHEHHQRSVDLSEMKWLEQ